MRGMRLHGRDGIDAMKLEDRWGCPSTMGLQTLGFSIAEPSPQVLSLRPIPSPVFYNFPPMNLFKGPSD